MRAVQAAERKAAQEAAVAQDLASRVWISIPFEAAEVREFAKANGAKWNPQTKCWGLATESVEAVKAKRDEWQTAQRAGAPLNLYAFCYKGALVEFEWTAGDTIWSADHDAYVVLVTVKRQWRTGEEDDGAEDEPGIRFAATGRLATPEEIAAHQAQRARNAAVTTDFLATSVDPSEAIDDL